MALFNKILQPLNGNTQIDRPYVDDIFDPLFNKAVIDYYRDTYDNPIVRPVAGYAEMIDNALLGQEGILGPGMGILSTFGRSMDKADDFLLGGLTEGVNLLGQFTGGTNPKPTNPITNIMVNDYDYEGTKLLAAMGNSMSRLAGTTTPLDETDFSSFGDRLAGMGIDLATDPGILGSRLAKLNPNTPVGKVGQLMSTYDDFMANVAGNLAFPGGKFLAKKGIHKIKDIIGGSSSKPYTDIVINSDAGYLNTGKDIEDTPNVEYYKMLNDFVEQGHINPLDDPEEWEFVQNAIKPYTRSNNTKKYASELIPDNIKRYKKDYDTVLKNAKDKTKIMPLDKYIKARQTYDDAQLKLGYKNYISRYNQSQSTTAPMSFKEYKEYAQSFKNEDTRSSKDFLEIYEREYGDITKLQNIRKEFESKRIKQLAEGVKPTADMSNPHLVYTQYTQKKVTAEEFEDGLNKIFDLDTDAKGTIYDYTRGENVSIYDVYQDGVSLLQDFKNNPTQKVYNDLIDFFNNYEGLYKQIPDVRPVKLHNQPYQFSMSTAALRKEASTEVFEQISNYTADLVRKQPYIFKDLKISNINEFPNAILIAIQKSFTENLPETTSIEDFYKILHESPNAKKLESRIKNLKFLLSNKKTNTIDDLIDALYKYNKNDNGEDYYTGLIPIIERFSNNLSQTKLGNDILDWAKNVKNVIDTVTIKEDLTSSVTKYLDTYLYGNTVSGYNKLINEFPDIDIKLKKNNQILIDSSDTPQSKMLSLLIKGKTNLNKDIFSKISAETYNKIIKNNEKDPFLVSMMSNFKIKGTTQNLFKDGSKFKGLSPLSKDIILVPNTKAMSYLNGIEKIGDKYYITNNDALSLFSKRDIPIDYRKEKFNFNKQISDSLTNYKNKLNNFSIIKSMENLGADEFAKEVTSNKSINDFNLMMLKEDIISSIGKRFDLGTVYPTDYKDLTKLVKTYGTPHEQTLYALIDAEQTSKINNKVGSRYGVYAHPLVKQTKDTIDKLYNKYSEAQVKDFLINESKMQDQIIKGSDMISYIIGSGGHVETIISNAAQYNTLKKVIQSNIDEVNKYGKILELVDSKTNGKYVLGYRFNISNNMIKKDINKYYSILSKNQNLKDMVFFKSNVTAENLKKRETYADLYDVFSKIREASEDLSTKMGFTNFNENYIKFAMKDDPKTAKEFIIFASQNGNDLNRLQQISDVLSELNAKGTFGNISYNRAYLGTFDMYPNLFSTNLKEIHSSTFTKGMLDNTYTQTYSDLFLSGNFSIKNNFKDVDTLRNALFAKDANGHFTGNLDNLAIVSPKYNNEGKLIGFKRYNKFSDIELQNAFNDESAILVPNNIIGALDRICKKGLRMDSKVFKFINKYLTVPFKFGTLASPGFLVGNMEDAYFKQALEMTKKYNTTLEEELTNVAESIADVVQLNNLFRKNVFDAYCQFLKSAEAKSNIAFRNSVKLADLDLLTPELIINNPKYSREWVRYLNSDILEDGPNRQLAKLYTFLNVHQNNAMYDNTLDIEDLINAGHKDKFKNPYNVPLNHAERIIYGDARKRGVSSYGLFLNNPVSNTILNTSSQIENIARSASILNDLKHRGLSIEKLSKTLEIPKEILDTRHQNLIIDMQEAINTMHSINFDYDNVSELMHKLSYIVPFPTFYLKNIAYWLDILVERPQYIDNIISAHEAMWSAKEEDTKNDKFTAEAKGRGAIPVGTGNKFLSGFVKQSPYSSMFGAFNAINDMPSDIAFRSNPILRPITRHLQDEEDVRYRPYSMDPYEKNIKQSDPQFNNLAYMFHQLNPYDRFINNYARLPRKIETNNAKLSDFVPSIIQPDFGTK